MIRRTKIVATLGPATDRNNNLEKIIEAGASMVRMNFSHGDAKDHMRRAGEVREIASRLGKVIAIMGDLQGPKIRISTFKNSKVQLSVGDEFALDSDIPKGEGDHQAVGLDYKNLPREVDSGDILLLDDGRIQLLVKNVISNKVVTEVIIGGALSNNKGINKKGGGLSAPALTEKDKQDIVTAAEIGCDFIAVSFPRNGDDLHYARKLAKAAGCTAKIVAKIERAEAVESQEALEEIILASDVVMVARGDLGVEIGDANLVGVQKNMIRTTRRLNRVVITATQMMESMISAPMATRAEVMDVANAVLDGTDAVMLSGETAAGDYPIETVKAMSDICIGAEKHPSINVSNHRINNIFDDTGEALAMTAMFAANHANGIKAIVALTETGTTPLLMSRLSSGLPIYALSSNLKTLSYCALYRGVTPLQFDSTTTDSVKFIQNAVTTLKEAGYLKSGDKLILTHGDENNISTTNTCKILTA